MSDTVRCLIVLALAVVQVYLLGRLCTWAMGSYFLAFRCDFLQWQFALKRSHAL